MLKKKLDLTSGAAQPGAAQPGGAPVMGNPAGGMPGMPKQAPGTQGMGKSAGGVQGMPNPGAGAGQATRQSSSSGPLKQSNTGKAGGENVPKPKKPGPGFGGPPTPDFHDNGKSSVGRKRLHKRNVGIMLPVIFGLVISAGVFVLLTFMYKPWDYGLTNRIVISVDCFLPFLIYPLKFKGRFDGYVARSDNMAHRWMQKGGLFKNFVDYLISVILLAVLIVGTGFLFDRNNDLLRLVKPLPFSVIILAGVCILHLILWAVQRFIYLPKADMR